MYKVGWHCPQIGWHREGQSRVAFKMSFNEVTVGQAGGLPRIKAKPGWGDLRPACTDAKLIWLEQC